MGELMQIPLEGDAKLLVSIGQGDLRQPDTEAARSGPIRAGLAEDYAAKVVAVASISLRDALEPVTAMSGEVLEQLRKAKPKEIKVEFGVELTANAGAVIAKAGSGCHLTVS